MALVLKTLFYKLLPEKYEFFIRKLEILLNLKECILTETY